MALRPGRCLLMSSHFIPSPRSWMILASSSTDHFDCFFAGDSAAKPAVRSAGRLAGMTLEVDVVVGVLDVLDCAATLVDAVSERASERLRGGEGLSLVATSSSLGLSSREISTLDAWCQDWPQG